MVKPTRWPSLQQRRKLWVEVHLWLGLVLGGFLTIFGVTGLMHTWNWRGSKWME